MQCGLEGGGEGGGAVCVGGGGGGGTSVIKFVSLSNHLMYCEMTFP